MPPRSREEIKKYLTKRDSTLRPLLRQLEFPVAKRNRDVYATLIHSIIAQQLSIKSADAIHARLLALFPDAYPSAERVMGMSIETLRATGLSRQKVSYLKAIARFSLGQGMSYPTLAKLSDDQIIDYLTQIHGVGRWTVEMLLIFTFNRSDVFSVDDVGIQNTMRQLYKLNQNGTALKQRMLTIAEAWRPYRTLVCKYLWRWKALG